MAQPVLYPQFFENVAGPCDAQRFQQGYEQLLKESRCSSIDEIVCLAKKLLSRENALNDLSRMHNGFCNISKYYEIVKMTDNVLLGHLYKFFPQLFEQKRKDLQATADLISGKIGSLKSGKVTNSLEILCALTAKEEEIHQTKNGLEAIKLLMGNKDFCTDAKQIMAIISDLGRGPALPLMQTIRIHLLNLQKKYKESKFDTFAAMLFCNKEYALPLAEQLIKIREDEISLAFSIVPSDHIIDAAIIFRMLAAAFRFCVGDKIADAFDLLFDHFINTVNEGLQASYSRVFSGSNDFFASIKELMHDEPFSKEVQGLVFSFSSVYDAEPARAFAAMGRKFIEFSNKVKRCANEELLIAALLTEKYSLPCFILRMKQEIEKDPQMALDPICRFFCSALDFCCSIDPRYLADMRKEASDDHQKVRERVLKEISRRTLPDRSQNLLIDGEFVQDAKQLFADFLSHNPLGGTWTKREQFIRQYWEKIVLKHSIKIGVTELETYGADDDLVLVEATIAAAQELVPQAILKMKSLDEGIIGKPHDSQEYSFMNFYLFILELSKNS